MAHTPFFQQFDSVSLPNGTWIKPGGQVVAYVRSSGFQNGDLPGIQADMVATIAAGVNRCRSGMNDVVVVLPGHTQTLTAASPTLFTPVIGAQIIGVGNPWATNAPNVTLSATTATIALSAANMTISGLNINSATAGVTGAIVVTAAGVTLANNFINFTGALGANPGIAVTAAANFSLLNNHYICSCTDPMVEVTGASSNLVAMDNLFKQLVTGDFFVTASPSTGMVARNLAKTAGATPLANSGFTFLAATAWGNFENYVCLNTAAGGLLADGVA